MTNASKINLLALVSKWFNFFSSIPSGTGNDFLKLDFLSTPNVILVQWCVSNQFKSLRQEQFCIVLFKESNAINHRNLGIKTHSD